MKKAQLNTAAGSVIMRRLASLIKDGIMMNGTTGR